jgi:hypothetical protein
MVQHLILLLVIVPIPQQLRNLYLQIPMEAVQQDRMKPAEALVMPVSQELGQLFVV